MERFVEFYETGFELRDEGVEAGVVGIPGALEEGMEEFDGRCFLDWRRYSRIQCSCTGTETPLVCGWKRWRYSLLWMR